MSHVSSVSCNTDAGITFITLCELDWGKPTTARDHIVLRFKSEGRDFDIMSMLSNGYVRIVFVLVFVSKHSREDVVVHGAESILIG